MDGDGAPLLQDTDPLSGKKLRTRSPYVDSSLEGAGAQKSSMKNGGVECGRIVSQEGRESTSRSSCRRQKDCT